MNRVIADDGLHFEHFVLSSADAERMSNGEMRFKLIRPLKNVKAIRLVYAELPKTTRTLDLLVDVATSRGRLVTQQLARSVKANENTDTQRASFGRIFVQDFETDDFFEYIANGVLSKGTVPRFLYENVNPKYMRFEFRPSAPSLQNLNLRVYSSLLDENDKELPYTADIHVVTTGTAYRDRFSTLVTTDRLAQLVPFVLQPTNVRIRDLTSDEYMAFLANIGNAFNARDCLLIAATEEDGFDYLKTNAAGSAGKPALFSALYLDLLSKSSNSPSVSLEIADSSPPKLDSLGIVTSPCLYSIKTLPAAFYRYMFQSKSYTFGTMHPISWLTRYDISPSMLALPGANKPLLPYAFRAETFTYADDAAETAREANLQAARTQRCIIELSPEMIDIVNGSVPVEYLTDLALDGKQPSFYKLALKYFLRFMHVRTQPQLRPVHGVLNNSLKAEQVQLYSVADVFLVDSTLKTFVIKSLKAAGREFDAAEEANAMFIAVEMDRSINAFTDPEAFRVKGAPVDLVASRGRYLVGGSTGTTVEWELDSLLTAAFPITMTFEAEIAQYQD